MSTAQPLARNARQRGQGMTEYIIIVALIAIAAIGVITMFGNNIRTLFGISAGALAGQDNLRNDGQQRDPQREQKNLQNFGEYR